MAMFKKFFQPAAQKKSEVPPSAETQETSEPKIKERLIALFADGQEVKVLSILNNLHDTQLRRMASIQMQEIASRWGPVSIGLNKMLLDGGDRHLTGEERRAVKDYNDYRKKIYDPTVKKLDAARKSIEPLQSALKKYLGAKANGVRLQKLLDKAKRAKGMNQTDSEKRIEAIEQQISNNNARIDREMTGAAETLRSADFSNFSQEDLIAAIKETGSDTNV